MRQSKAPVACPICKGSRFVCENHPRLAWPSECECGAGDPCPVCNVAEPRALPENFVVDVEADALHDALERFAAKPKKTCRSTGPRRGLEVGGRESGRRATQALILLWL